VGHPALIRQSIDLLDWGGSCVLLGVPKFGSEASFVVNTLYNDKSILGCRYGSARPHHDIPLFVKLYQEGKLKLDELVSARFAPEQVQDALDAMHDGGLNRAVLDFV
jgi:S-(hydroxymethyl)glutathione dehydrogenase/alcohol dehydrogenase